MTGSYEDFKNGVYALMGIVLDGYKESQMKRRIDSLIERSGAGSYEKYYEMLVTDRKKYDEFIGFFTINVSEFWRNPEQWQLLEDKMLKYFEGNGSIKIWSAACSSGDEAYSLAMLLLEHPDMENFSIIGTDIDAKVLKVAKKGVYNKKSLGELPQNYIEKYLTQTGEDEYKVSDIVRNHVLFRQHDLLKDNYPLGFDLIVCRNVLIYFTEDAKKNIYRGFNRSLRPGGILFLGNTEQIINPADYGFVSVSSFFYKKVVNLY